jgi:hypothetical protein
MQKTHEVQRLHFDLKLIQRQIARCANLSQRTVHVAIISIGLVAKLMQDLFYGEDDASNLI